MSIAGIIFVKCCYSKLASTTLDTVTPVKKAYGNRIPPVYRWAVSLLILIALGLAVVAGVSQAVDLLTMILLGIVGIIFLAIYATAGTTMSADSETAKLSLFPLWRKRIPVAQISSIEVEPIKPIDREWGNRGFLRKSGEIFVDAGQSRHCLAFYLGDGIVNRLGVSSPEQGQVMKAALQY